jgi:hypothetical protein
MILQQDPLVRRFPDDVLRFRDAFAALVAGPQAGSEIAYVMDALLQNGLADLMVGDLLADTDVHKDAD